MASRDFSGRDVVKALTKNRFVIADRTGSHVKLRYEHPTNDDDVRVVSVQQHDRIRIGMLQRIEAKASRSARGRIRQFSTLNTNSCSDVLSG